MKVPEYIKKAIKKNAYHSALASKNNDIIRDWLQKNNLNNGATIDQLIDAVEIGYNPDEFIKFLEKEAEDFGRNNDEY